MNAVTGAAPELLPWVIGLAVGFPLLLLVGSEIASRLARRDHPLASTLKWMLYGLLPALALVVLLRFVIGLPPANLWPRLATTVVWVLLVITALGAANALLFESATPGSWQRRIPKLLRDLVRLLLIGLAAAIVYAQVWDKDLTGALAALGVTSIVLGLALQEPLGNLFSGLMLLMERPFEVGDDIEVGSINGVVKEINWRSVHVQSLGGLQRVIPNSTLNKETITNYSRPRRMRMEIVEVAFSYEDPPNRVRAALLETALETPMILHDPAPIIATWSYADSSVVYRIIYRTHEADRWPARNELMSRLWYATRRHGLTMPFPIGVNLLYKQDEPFGKSAVSASELLKQFRKIPPLPAGQAAESMRTLTFGAGEPVFARDDELCGIHLLVSGSVSLQAGNGADAPEVTVVQAGEFFGEAGLYGRQPSDLRAVAMTDCTVLLIDPDTVRSLFEASPPLAREAGTAMNLRRRAAMAARNKAAGGERV